MVAHWLVLVLLSICSLSSSQECSPGLQEDIDFPGTDITWLYSPDAEHCQLLCTNHPSCLFFTFLRPDWTRDSRHFYCYLKSTPSGRPNTETNLTGATSGYSLKSCTSSKQPCLPKVYHNVDFFGADYKTLFTADYEECQKACTHDHSCQFFTFVTEPFSVEKIRYKCHLKFSWNVPTATNVERKAGVVSGFSHKPQSGNSDCRTKMFPNADIPGSDFGTQPAVSAEHCQSMCSAHPSCTYFSFVSDRLECYLKKGQDTLSLVAKIGVTSGLPSRFCQPENTWVTVPHEDVDFRCCNVRFEEMSDPDACQRTCTNHPHCQFYTHVNQQFSNPVYWNRCYLKGAITMPAPPKVAKLDNVVSGFSKRNCGAK